MRNSLYIIKQSFTMSIQNIFANKMRSFLTTLGIIIGVASVISLMTIVEGATKEIMDEFSSMGASTLSLSIMGSTIKDGLTDAELDELRKIDGITGISPSTSFQTASVVDGIVYDKVDVTGADVLYFTNGNEIQAGRAFNAADMSGNVNVCIVDDKFVENAFKGKSVIGHTITLNGISYTVIGIGKESDSLFSMMFYDNGIDGTVIVPYKNALYMTGKRTISSATIYFEGDSKTVQNKIEDELDIMFNHAEKAYSIYNMESLMESLNSITGMMQGLLGGIASIALLVGGIGIMNMMLVSVSERTKEIGLRKALGAEPKRIQLQFLIESMVLSLFGGIIGIMLGNLIAFGGSKLMKSPFVISPKAIIIGFSFSLIIGVVFGWSPAKKASKMNPIDALRSD